MRESLFNQASRNFNKYLRAFLDQGEVYMLPRERMSDAQWRDLNKYLVSYGVRMIPMEQNGVRYMRFAAASQNQVSSKDNKSTDSILDSILGEYKEHRVKRGVVPVYIYDQPGLGKGRAQSLCEKIINAGKHYATILAKSGRGAFDDYIVVAIKKSDAENNLGAVWEDGALVSHLDSKGTMRYIRALVGEPLAYINNTPVLIDSIDDFGVASQRAILLVSVGGKKLPFYISSGVAGKTEVPVGKWEFFGGRNSSGWFRKGTQKEILNHYDSPELKYIAEALDGKIGDVRDTVDILKSAGREYLGGRGDVAYMKNAPVITNKQINQDVFYPEGDGVFYLDLKIIKDYLKGLSDEKSMVQKMQNSQQKLKDAIKARVASWFRINDKQEKK